MGSVNSEMKYKVRWYLRVQGQCTEVFRKQVYYVKPHANKREAIGDFSRQSRMRLMRTNARVDWKAVGRAILVSVTYPPSVGERTKEERTVDRYLLSRYIEKHMKKRVPMIWRCEWKIRLSGKDKGKVRPHFHLLVLGVKFIGHWLIRKWWRLILKVSGPLATDVRNASSGEQASAYMTKYLSKNGSLEESTYHNSPNFGGRHWGITRKSLIPWSPVSSLSELDCDEAKACRAFAAHAFDHYHPEFGGGFTVFGLEARNALFSILGEKC